MHTHQAKIDPSSVDYLHVDDEDAQEDAEAQAEDEKKLDAKSFPAEKVLQLGSSGRLVVSHKTHSFKVRFKLQVWTL